MKLISKMYLVIASILFCNVTLTTRGIVFAAENTWQNAYMEVIESTVNADSSDIDHSAFSLMYIDSDNIPELFAWDGKTYQTLYSYNSEATLCKELSYRGTVWSISESGCFWTSDGSNAEYEYYNFHSLENGLCNVVYSFCIDRSEAPTEKFLINNEEVNAEEYKTKISELELICPLSPEYIINVNLKYSYDEIKQYLTEAFETSTTITPPTTTSTTIDRCTNTTTSTTTIGTGDSVSETTTFTTIRDDETETTFTTTTITDVGSETATSSTSTETITSSTITSIETTTIHIASDEELCEWAVKDYEEKTGVTPADAEIEYTADDTAVITLTDAEGNVLDVYTIDPITGTGTESEGEEVNLPQTGYSVVYNYIMLAAAAIVLFGIFSMAKSRKRDSE